MRRWAGTPTLDVVVTHVERRNVLLVLAGCEAGPAACADLIAAVSPPPPTYNHRHQPGAVGVAGEAVYEVPPLSAPDLFRLPALDRLGDFDAVRLFVERAAAVVPGFDVRASDAPGLAQIIRRLDAIPLAVELAAARVTGAAMVWLVLDVADRFPLLDGGRRAPESRRPRWMRSSTGRASRGAGRAPVSSACRCSPAGSPRGGGRVCEGFADTLLCGLTPGPGGGRRHPLVDPRYPAPARGQGPGRRRRGGATRSRHHDVGAAPSPRRPTRAGQRPGREGVGRSRPGR